MWPANGSMTNFLLGRSTERRNRTGSKDLTLMVEKKVAKPISNIDGFVKHVYREHNQEADFGFNMAHKDKGKWSLTDVIIPRRGRR